MTTRVAPGAGAGDEFSARSGPTGAPDGLPDVSALRRPWRQWAAAVELFARRRRGRRRVDPRAYQAVHGELLAACRALAASCEGEQRARCQRLEEMVRPWMSCRVLELAEAEILLDLLARCRQAEREWGLRTRADAARRWLGPGLALLAALAAAGFLAATANWLLLPAWGWLKDWLHVTWLGVKRSSDLELLGVGGVLVVLVAIYVVSRAARS